MPEDPPGHRDHPHDQDNHDNDVVKKIEDKLTAQSSVILTAPLYMMHDSVDGYPDQEEEDDPHSSNHQDPG